MGREVAVKLRGFHSFCQWMPINEVPFTKDHLGVQIFAKSVMGARELTLSFPFMEQENLYETQPGGYISHLVGHEGPGSIMSYAKSKGWANGLLIEGKLYRVRFA